MKESGSEKLFENLRFGFEFYRKMGKKKSIKKHKGSDIIKKVKNKSKKVKKVKKKISEIKKIDAEENDESCNETKEQVESEKKEENVIEESSTRVNTPGLLTDTEMSNEKQMKEVQDTEITVDNANGTSEARFFKLDSNELYAVLFLGLQQKVAVMGYGQIAVAHGSCEMYGYRMNADKYKFIDWYSPSTSSLLYIKDISTSLITVKAKATLLKNLRKKWKVSLDDESLDNIASCVLFKRLNICMPYVLKSINNYDGLITRDIEVLTPPFQVRVYNEEDWCDVTTKIKEQKKQYDTECSCSIMLCGGKDVGKSSFAKFLINDLLSTHDTVFYLECDCGQTEFTPPGILSLVKVEKALLGPPFTHSVQLEKCYFFGNITPKDDPNEYIRLITLLYEFYMQNCDGKIPLVVNQQGWVKGLGLCLLVDCIRVVSPDFIIQIQSKDFESRNLSEDLSDDFIAAQPGWSIPSGYKSLSTKKYLCKYLKMTSVVDGKSVGSSKASTSRNLAITSYFSHLFDNSFQESFKNDVTWVPPPLHTIQPYMIRWKDVAIHVMHENVKRDIMYLSFNMALVCLAVVDDDLIVTEQDAEENSFRYLHSRPCAQYIGLGVVRNIDFEKKCFYILTPEPVDHLQSVNALLKGNVELPNGFFNRSAPECMPYLSVDNAGINSKFAGKAKPRFNLKRKPSKMKNSMEIK